MINIMHVRAFRSTADHCAVSMMAQEEFIRCEMKRLRLPKELANDLDSLCRGLITPMFDVRPELGDLEELLESEALQNHFRPFVQSILESLREPIMEIDRLKQKSENWPRQNRHVRNATSLLLAVGIDLFPDLQSVMQLGRRILDSQDDVDRLPVM